MQMVLSKEPQCPLAYGQARRSTMIAMHPVIGNGTLSHEGYQF